MCRTTPERQKVCTTPERTELYDTSSMKMKAGGFGFSEFCRNYQLKFEFIKKILTLQ